ncbi:MAG: hypothetical protein IT314_07220 [Anaerolineales bacterium]|nr:hypothetical protein [Anaerolineales bacterium]
MNSRSASRQVLVQKLVADMMEMPENEILAILEAIQKLKKLRGQPNPILTAEIMAQATVRAAETSHHSHEELMKEFSETLTAINLNTYSANSSNNA